MRLEKRLSSIWEWFSKKVYEYRYPIGVYFVVRLLISFVGVFAFSAVPGTHGAPVAEGYAYDEFSKTEDLLYGLWERSDSLWFYHIARDGYVSGSPDAVFFPLYPMCIRFVHTVTGLSFHLSGLLVANFFLVIALIFLYRLVRFEFDEETAKKTLWYQILYPGSLFLFIGYSESLFLACVVASFYYARKGEWLKAGIAGGLLSLTRHVGFTVALPLGIEFLLQRLKPGYFKGVGENVLRGSFKERWATGAFLFLIPVFLSAYLIYQQILSGDALIWVKGHGHWNRESHFPWDTLLSGIKQAIWFSGAHPGGMYVLEAACAVFALAFGLAIFSVLTPSYGVMWFLFYVPALCSPFTGRMLMSFCRIIVVIFPLFIVLARIVKSEMTDMFVKLILTALLGIAIALLVNNQQFF
jgi:hypothetical protein